MILTEEKRKEFEEVVKPVMKWLNENCHPHVHIIISTTNAELSEGVSAIHTMEFVKD